MNCSNKTVDFLKALCATAILLVSVNACTEVDDRLGSSILPRNQKMKIRIDTLSGTQTYLYKEDSIPSSRLGYAYFGKEEDAVFGRRKNSFIVQFVPSSFPTSYRSGTAYKNFGINPIIDSICIFLPLYDVHGDTTRIAGTGQMFDVYEFTEGPDELWLSRDSTYYANFPIDDHKGDKLFSFTHYGHRSVATKLIPTQKGKDYLKRIVNIKMDDYKDDSLFHMAFRGLYITPADGSPANAAVYASNLASAGLMMYSRCHDTLDIKAIYDTVYTTFKFRDTDDASSSSYTIPYSNVSVNIVDSDYSSSTYLGPLEVSTNGFTDTLATSAAQPLMFVQPMNGVTGYLRFTDDMINKLRDLRYEVDDKGENVKHDILINQAMMYIWLEDGWDTSTLNSSMKRMGSYSALKSLTPIPDYLYYSEWVQRNSTNGNAKYVLPYNGYLNRSNGYYELDITSFVQQLAKGAPGDPYEINPVINIASEAYGFFKFGQSVLQGYDPAKEAMDPMPGDYKPVKIKLTYTLIEED